MSYIIAFLKTKVFLPLFAAILAFSGIVLPRPLSEAPTPTATSSTISLAQEKATSTASTTLKIRIVSPTAAKPVVTAVSSPVATPSISKEKQILLDRIKRGDILPTEAVNVAARASLINVFCTSTTGGDFDPVTSATGIIVSQDGLVLTNAHVAQYLLLENYKTPGFLKCVGRTGSPAVPAYTLALSYIPRIWMEENAEKIIQENPSSTGENDYALLKITGTVSGAPVPPLPYLSTERTDVYITGTPVVLAAYPAGFLEGVTLQSNLWLTSSASDMGTLYYFNTQGTVDVFGVNGNILSQKGASGGAVLSLLSGKLTGLITTATAEATTGERELMALTLPYVRGAFEKNSGISWDKAVESPASIPFDNAVRDALAELLIKEIEHR